MLSSVTLNVLLENEMNNGILQFRKVFFNKLLFLGSYLVVFILHWFDHPYFISLKIIVNMNVVLCKKEHLEQLTVLFHR